MSWRPAAIIAMFVIVGPIVGSVCMLPLTPNAYWAAALAIGWGIGLFPALAAGAVFCFWIESRPLQLGASLVKTSAIGAASGLLGSALSGALLLLVLKDDISEHTGYLVVLGLLIVPGILAGAGCALIVSYVDRRRTRSVEVSRSAI